MQHKTWRQKTVAAAVSAALIGPELRREIGPVGVDNLDTNSLATHGQSGHTLISAGASVGW